MSCICLSYSTRNCSRCFSAPSFINAIWASCVVRCADNSAARCWLAISTISTANCSRNKTIWSFNALRALTVKLVSVLNCNCISAIARALAAWRCARCWSNVFLIKAIRASSAFRNMSVSALAASRFSCKRWAANIFLSASKSAPSVFRLTAMSTARPVLSI